MTSPRIDLYAVPGSYWVHRFDPRHPVPTTVLAAAGIVSVTRTDQELSVLSTLDTMEGSIEPDGPWTAWYLRGPIPFGLTGVVASVVAPLAAIECPVFVVSTFDGDIVCVPAEHDTRARIALTDAGHRLHPLE